VLPNGVNGSAGKVGRDESHQIARLHQLSDQIVICGSLAAADLSWLASQRRATVIDLRTVGEEVSGGLSFAEERRLATELGIAYHHIPIARGIRPKEAVAEVRVLLRAAAARVLLHCTDGARAGAVALIHLGCDAGRSLGQCYTQAAQLPVQPPVEAWVGYILDEPRRALPRQSPYRHP